MASTEYSLLIVVEIEKGIGVESDSYGGAGGGC
jgi:hypothetical protein